MNNHRSTSSPGWSCRIGVIFFFLSFVLLPSSFASAASPWTLTSADFQSRQVDLVAITPQAVSIKGPAGPQSVPMDDLLQLSHDIPAATLKPGAFDLQLTTGDRLTGDPVAITGESLTWASPAVGRITVPLRRVRAIAKATAPAAAPPPPASPATGQQPPAEDTVTLANGDMVKGIVAGLDGKTLNVSQNGETVPVPLDSVVKLVFASAGKPDSGQPPARAFRVRLADGTTLTAQAVTVTGDAASLTFPGDDQPRKIPLASVASIEQVNGPVTFLSSLTPVEDVQRPYLGQPWPTRMDRTVTGDPIRLPGQPDDLRGIGVHAYSKLTFPIGPTYKTFRTQYALDGGGPYANVTVRILLDGKPAYERQNVTSPDPSPVVALPLNGAKSITLEVDYGLSNDTQDRFLWLQPALLR